MITFVSAFLKLEDKLFEWYKDINNCFLLFENLFQAKDIKIILYLSPCFKEYGDNLISKYTDNLVINYIELEDLWTYNEVLKITDMRLPEKRNVPKDTVRYISLQNSKLELIQKAMEQNYFKTNHFAWIDFRIFHIIKEDKKTIFIQDLEKIIHNKLKDNLFVIPGCWPDKYCKIGSNNFHLLINFLNTTISWRFCGGFILGDQESLIKFFQIFKFFWPVYLSQKLITWEVNVWHYMELKNMINPLWFKADHNETIIQIPEECYQI
jgi:hypothetical protein